MPPRYHAKNIKVAPAQPAPARKMRTRPDVSHNRSLANKTNQEVSKHAAMAPAPRVWASLRTLAPKRMVARRRLSGRGACLLLFCFMAKSFLRICDQSSKLRAIRKGIIPSRDRFLADVFVPEDRGQAGRLWLERCFLDFRRGHTSRQ